MDSSSGRYLTSCRGGASDPTTFKPCDPVTLADAPFIPNALDFAYRAFLADNTVALSVPPGFSNAQAVDSASFAGRGASFTVYRRRIPPQKPLTSRTNVDGLLIEIRDKRKLPEVVAYKVAVIEFSDKGEATHTSWHAIDAAIMELYLSTHRPILQHPNLVDFLGLAWGANPFNSLQKLPVLMVEFAEYGSLSQLQQREYLGIETRRKLCLDVCKGLHMLHSCGIVHGDIKAQNVLIFADAEHKYRAKVNNFGYSQVINTERSSLLLGGTRPWKAPEAKTAVKVSDAKYTDIYLLSLFIWCTFAHGQNIFKLLVDPSNQCEEFYAEAEKLKETEELAAQTDISAWYLKAIMATTYGDTGQFLQHFQSLQQQLQQNNAQANHSAVGIDDIEKILCAIPPVFFQTLEPLKQQLIATVQRLGLYDAMKGAVTIGLSNEPHQRDLDQIMVALGHRQHFFTWRHWTGMEPSIQGYLTTTYIQRGEGEVKKGMINPPEAFLLTALYINGYGVDKDTSQALRWLFNAWGVKHPLASAYGYRIARAIGLTPDNADSVIETLELMALRGSRIALEDLAMLSKDTYEKTKKTIRDVLAGTGANFFWKTEMLHGFAHNMWMRTFENITILLENSSQFDSIADYTANKRGDRILHVAACCGQTEAIGALLNRFPSLEVNQLNDQGETPLLCACRAGYTDTVLWLTSNGATASVAPNGESPLHWLVSFDDEEIESVGPALIQAGADTNAKTTTFIAYQAAFPASLDIDRLPEGYPIGWARDELVEYLLKHGADVMKAGENYDEEVLQSQDVGAFKMADINCACGVDLRTPLLEAVRWNRPTMVNLLLEHGAHATGASKNPFSGLASTWTALHVLAFISHGADINLSSLSSGHLSFTNPTTIFGHVIASNARNSITRLRYLLGSADCLNFIVEPTRQWTALHRAAAAHIDDEFRGTDATEAAELDWADIDWSANREIMNELLLQFNDPEQLDAVEESMGLTAMHLAVLAGNEAAVKLLLDKGARSDVPSADGQGPTAAVGIQMERLPMSEVGARPGEEEVATRKRCNDLLNPRAQPAA
ncbi:uncharacterized protein FIESC28_05428 [Fusarium coffeatum]|uniref:Protein kinase domain-containing protein n=1 Tax=Fusarium coffeatum TaxID=231269 RepID=A0A366RST3_9HYPO|nr:uncharacterized protein FIESC28_05428 [Fusarium coffeatum]RBR20149.1 hypothetical protein FIESC28_05428 [Fusarium coffeatum]